MSDEALNVHLDWLEDCEKEQGEDYETWLEKQVAQLKKEIALKADYITRLETEAAGRDLMDAEANEFLSGMEIVPEGTLAENTILAAKLLAIECGDCALTMLECTCDDEVE